MYRIDKISEYSYAVVRISDGVIVTFRESLAAARGFLAELERTP